ncbi:TPA: hypothetical protein QDB28_004670 [Burkholderia vietnamiensis]|nr:hypothetical protein [Burkholderia vietnamiensis]
MLPRAFENSCMRRGRMRAGIVKGRDSGEFRGAPIWLCNSGSTMAADDADAHVRDGGTCGSMASWKAQDSISFCVVVSGIAVLLSIDLIPVIYRK